MLNAGEAHMYILYVCTYRGKRAGSGRSWGTAATRDRTGAHRAVCRYIGLLVFTPVTNCTIVQLATGVKTNKPIYRHTARWAHVRSLVAAAHHERPEPARLRGVSGLEATRFDRSRKAAGLSYIVVRLLLSPDITHV